MMPNQLEQEIIEIAREIVAQTGYAMSPAEAFELLSKVYRLIGSALPFSGLQNRVLSILKEGTERARREKENLERRSV